MILPAKHLSPERALLSVGGHLLEQLDAPQTVSSLWDSVRARRETDDPRAPISYDWFILALDLLFMMGAVSLDRGVVRRSTQ